METGWAVTGSSGAGVNESRGETFLCRLDGRGSLFKVIESSRTGDDSRSGDERGVSDLGEVLSIWTFGLCRGPIFRDNRDERRSGPSGIDARFRRVFFSIRGGMMG